MKAGKNMLNLNVFCFYKLVIRKWQQVKESYENEMKVVTQ